MLLKKKKKDEAVWLVCVKKGPFLLGHVRNVTTNDDSSVLREKKKKHCLYWFIRGWGTETTFSFFNGTSSKCTIL